MSNLLDFEKDIAMGSGTQLQFHESVDKVPTVISINDMENGRTEDNFNSYGDLSFDSDNKRLQQDDSEDERSKAPTHSFWSLEYYQSFFNVNTEQVKDRILWSMIPKPGNSYIQHYIRPNPDLYGPFWICVTLVFTIAISGNLANYFSRANQSYHWKYQFHTVTYAATAIFSYCWIMPIILWGILRWGKRNETKITLLEMLCLYGYSLSIYIPVSVLWVIQINWLQWTLVILGAFLSGSVLLMSLWSDISGNNRYILITLILGFHILLAAGFMLSFFHVPPLDDHVVHVNSTVPTNHTKEIVNQH